VIVPDLAAAVEDIRSRFLADPQVVQAEVQLSDLADAAVAQRWTGVDPTGWAALAVGGYGRRALHPLSDLDILFFVRGEKPEPDWVDRMLDRLGDVPFDSEGDLASERDFTTFDPSRAFIYGAFLDARRVAGNPETAKFFASVLLPAFVERHREDFVRALVSTRADRMPRPGGVEAEPDLKLSPGGLADLRWIGWMRRLKPTTAAQTPGIEALGDHKALLCRLRTGVQFLSPTAGNLLVRDVQPAVARLLGWVSPQGNPDVDRLMNTYRAAANAVFDVAETLAGMVEFDA
jgi:[protein-PII] uridylyltransferase